MVTLNDIKTIAARSGYTVRRVRRTGHEKLVFRPAGVEDASEAIARGFAIHGKLNSRTLAEWEEAILDESTRARERWLEIQAWREQ